MRPSIFLAVSLSSNYKKKVVEKIVDELKSNVSIKLEYNIDRIIYQSFNDISNFLKANLNSTSENIIIFVDIPNISLEEIYQIKSMAKIFQVFADIPEHYHSFFKYTQFISFGF